MRHSTEKFMKEKGTSSSVVKEERCECGKLLSDCSCDNSKRGECCGGGCYCE